MFFLPRQHPQGSGAKAARGSKRTPSRRQALRAEPQARCVPAARRRGRAERHLGEEARGLGQQVAPSVCRRAQGCFSGRAPRSRSVTEDLGRDTYGSDGQGQGGGLSARAPSDPTRLPVSAGGQPLRLGQPLQGVLLQRPTAPALQPRVRAHAAQDQPRLPQNRVPVLLPGVAPAVPSPHELQRDLPLVLQRVVAHLQRIYLARGHPLLLPLQKK